MQRYKVTSWTENGEGSVGEFVAGSGNGENAGAVCGGTQLGEQCRLCMLHSVLY